MEENNGNRAETDNLTTMVPRIVAAARTGDQSGTARLLNRFLRVLHQEIARGSLSKDGLLKITFSLETLMAMQQMKDWVAFADILEYEFLPLWKQYSSGAF